MKIQQIIRASPIMLMLTGIPGSGKSTVAKYLADSFKELGLEFVIHSSDKLREELYGNENEQDHNAELFIELHQRIKNDLSNGISIIYDATNISKKRRCSFLQELRHISCLKICIPIVTPFDLCLKNNSTRERKVPEEAIKHMYMNWQPPDYSEGFDYIALCTFKSKNGDTEWTIDSLLKKMDGFDQENSHHSLSLGEHCKKAKQYIATNYPDNDRLIIAASIHDCGKIFTKTHINTKGVDDGECHYYQHQCVGAYDCILYLMDSEYGANDIIYISNLIYYHMHPFMGWQQSKSVERRNRIQIGEEMYDDIMKLHEADLIAH